MSHIGSQNEKHCCSHAAAMIRNYAQIPAHGALGTARTAVFFSLRACLYVCPYGPWMPAWNFTSRLIQHEVHNRGPFHRVFAKRIPIQWPKIHRPNSCTYLMNQCVASGWPFQCARHRGNGNPEGSCFSSLKKNSCWPFLQRYDSAGRLWITLQAVVSPFKGLRFIGGIFVAWFFGAAHLRFLLNRNLKQKLCNILEIRHLSHNSMLTISGPLRNEARSEFEDFLHRQGTRMNMRTNFTRSHWFFLWQILLLYRMFHAGSQNIVAAMSLQWYKIMQKFKKSEDKDTFLQSTTEKNSMQQWFLK